eukprot:scaffold322492_cov14-Prasinocladus_malaysianus.AAC.1
MTIYATELPPKGCDMRHDTGRRLQQQRPNKVLEEQPGSSAGLHVGVDVVHDYVAGLERALHAPRFGQGSSCGTGSRGSSTTAQAVRCTGGTRRSPVWHETPVSNLEKKQ